MDNLNIDDFDWGESNDWYKNFIGNEIFHKRIYEKFFTVEENDIVVDFGASTGIFTYSILPKNPLHVFCIEPSPNHFMTLVKNTSKGYVTCLNKGISDINGSMILPEVYGSENKSQIVSTIRFDTFIKKYNISKVDFLKTDCEGGEYHIFDKKNIWWIKNNVKKIVGEWHLETQEQKKYFREFRDLYLKLFDNSNVYSVDMKDIKWDLWNDHFIDYYNQILIYIDNT